MWKDGLDSRILSQGVRWIDHATEVLQDDVLVPFALEDGWSRRVGAGETPIVHVWRHERAMVLGLRDRKLPYAKDAIRWLENQGYRVGVRHSGGAAVPLDAGVLNVTLILPKPAGRIDFRDDFAFMAALIERCLLSFGLNMEIGEIAGSYCPGDYDLSVNGRKFCGLAQRRQTRAIAVQAFIVVEGSGDERVRIVQEYYRRAAGGAYREDGSQHPKVQSGSMASLAEMALAALHVEAGENRLEHVGEPLAAYALDSDLNKLTAERFKKRLYEIIQLISGKLENVDAAAFIPKEQELNAAIKQIRERYDRD